MKIIATNRRARYDYEIIDTWEAGIKLLGWEVKALRLGQVSIAEAWIKLSPSGAHLINSHISTAKPPKWDDYKPLRERLLLLHKREINKLNQGNMRGLTVIPLKIYFTNRGLAKVEIATAKGKK